MAADEEAIEEMLRDNPQDILQALFSWQKLGNAAMQVGYFEKAATAYSRMLQLSASNYRLAAWEGAAHANLGCLAIVTGQVKAAGAHFAKEECCARQCKMNEWVLKARRKRGIASSLLLLGVKAEDASRRGLLLDAASDVEEKIEDARQVDTDTTSFGVDQTRIILLARSIQKHTRLQSLIELAREKVSKGNASNSADVLPVLTYFRALTEAHGRKCVQAVACNDLGLVLRIIGDDELSLAWHHKALKHHVSIDNVEGIEADIDHLLASFARDDIHKKRLEQWSNVKLNLRSSQGSVNRNTLNLIRSLLADKSDASSISPPSDGVEVEQGAIQGPDDDALSSQQTWTADTPSSSSVCNSDSGLTAGGSVGWQGQGPPESVASRGIIPRAECVVIDEDLHRLQLHTASETAFVPSTASGSLDIMPNWTRHEGFLKQKVGILNTWKERRVVSALGILEIYRIADRNSSKAELQRKQATDKHGTAQTPDNSITLRVELKGCSVVSKQFGRQHFGIEIKLHNGNKIHFAAQGVMEQSKWIEVIQMQSTSWLDLL
uniref:PH domain-containing protein n=1 Tax=Hanusia phi TaxID=3032 RepID=A0A7S0HZD7_9CRYP|mmetsp:Transcript_6763/g.15617  ORF Transcript_6763/g.15617 Transcript_6763/m.15617 type:complete len:550 (+) Transcript_6763:33-1682(+)